MIRTVIFGFLLGFLPIAAQAVGTVTQNTTSNVIGTAGTLICTMTNTSPAIPSGVRVICTSAAVQVLVMDSVVTSGTNGMVGSLSIAGNIITWSANKTAPAATLISYEMVANGVLKAGTF